MNTRAHERATNMAARSELSLHRAWNQRASSIRKSDIILKIWIFVLGAAALVAARATYSLMSRGPARFGNDQVSSDWLATARIHEDQG